MTIEVIIAHKYIIALRVGITPIIYSKYHIKISTVRSSVV